MTCDPTITLAATTVAAAVGIFSPIALESYKRRRDRRLTAFVLAGVIEGTLDRTQDYGFVKTATAQRERLEGDETVSMKGCLLFGPFHDPILEAHYDKLGLLGDPLSQETTAFFGYISALRNDLKRLFDGDLDDHPQQMADVLRRGLDIWTREEPKARALVDRLRKSASLF